MTRPIVGIVTNSHLINDQYPAHAQGTMLASAVSAVSDCVPLLIPSDPALSSVGEILDICDGILLPGARPNVHPEEYGDAPTPAHGAFDRDRDRVALPLIREAIGRGQPIFGLCRGFQEVAVAMGARLHPEIRDLPGRMNHRMPPDGTLEEKFELRHAVRFTENGPFHLMMGAREVMTNTLHGQGIEEPGPRVVIDGVAPDGTPEAIYIRGASGFTCSVQWHPEWNATADPVSRRLFGAFGDAVRDWAGSEAAPARQSA